MKLISPSVDTSIYKSDGTLTGDRTVDVDSNVLSFINSDICIDARVKVPAFTDDDEDTAVWVEKTADEDRIRVESASTFFPENQVFHGHFDEDSFE